jgi:hypothetical protein
MNPLLRVRLLLDLASTSLLVFAIAYHWQGNLAHEIAGTAMFLLLIVHNFFNRRWFGNIAKPDKVPRARIDVAATLLLLIMMLVLLLTSVLVSETVFAALSLQGDGVFTARQVHAFAGWWVLVLVSVHLGLRWPLLMGVVGKLLRITQPSRSRTLVLRLLVAAIAVAGVKAWSALGVGVKLTLQLSLDWWNFEEAVLGFFLHCAAFAGLLIALTYYAMKWLPRRQQP